MRTSANASAHERTKIGPARFNNVLKHLYVEPKSTFSDTGEGKINVKWPNIEKQAVIKIVIEIVIEKKQC